MASVLQKSYEMVTIWFAHSHGKCVASAARPILECIGRAGSSWIPGAQRIWWSGSSPDDPTLAVTRATLVPSQDWNW